ncbi:MAG TPA: NFACT family protein [Thermodesulfobacteriota bacterium]
MGPLLLKEVVAELGIRLTGGIISKVHQSDERNIILKVFARGREERLIISAHHRLSRMHITERDYKNPPAPLRFCAFLRKWITNARIDAITQKDLERIAYIDLIKKKADGSREELRIIAELTGKSANIILTDKDGVILDALRYFPPETSMRAVAPGLRLEALPAAPGLKEEVIERKEGESWVAAVDRFYSGLVDGGELLERRSFLRKAVSGAEKKLRRKLNNLEGDRAKATAEVENYKTGELLASNFHLLKKGVKEAEVTDYTQDPPALVKVRMDERLGPKENVERYFKRARKGRKALELLKERIPALEEELEYVETLKYDIEAAETPGDLDDLEAELAKGGYLKKVERVEKSEEPRAEPVRRFVSSEGFEILCGKSGTGNDLLVAKYASGEDIWFHVKGLAGSHSLIKVAGRAGELTKKTIEEAASVAAFYSKAANAGKVEVIYAEARNVKKPRGAKPGMVTVKEYRSVVVRPGLPAPSPSNEGRQ